MLPTRERLTIIPCLEHEEVQVSIRDLMRSDGTLDLYEDVAHRGYFDIDFKKGSLVVKATRYVGIIPLSDRIAIHVTPRAPIANLLWMVARCGARVQGLQHFLRGYSLASKESLDVEDVYAESFLSALSTLKAVGPMKRYRSYQSDRVLRGRLLLSTSIARGYAQGLNVRPTFEVSDHTIDIEENQVLKVTAKRLKDHFVMRGGDRNRALAFRFRELEKLLGGVSDVVEADSSILRRIPIMLRRLPSSHRFYEPALWLSYLVFMKSVVRMEALGRVRFETLVFDVSLIFEQYVRKVLQEARSTVLKGFQVLDGNRNSVPLFASGAGYSTQPDYYFRHLEKDVALADAKYKAEPSTQDRYELLAFCEALDVKRAVFICPYLGTGPRRLHQGTTRSGKRIEIVRLDLAATDLKHEEDQFLENLVASLGLSTHREVGSI